MRVPDKVEEWLGNNQIIVVLIIALLILISGILEKIFGVYKGIF